MLTGTHEIDFTMSRQFKESCENPISKAGKEVSGLYSNTTDGVGKFFKRTKKGATGLYDDTTGGVGNFFISLWRSSGTLGLGILNTIPKVFNVVSNFVSDSLVNLFSSFFETLVSSHKIISEFLITSKALIVISPRFPMGVATQYSPGFKLIIF